MPKISPPAPGESMIIWAARAGPEAIEFLNAIGMMEMHLVPASGANAPRPGIAAIFGDPHGPLILQLPLMFDGPISNPTTNTTSLQTAVVAILTALRRVGQLPG